MSKRKEDHHIQIFIDKLPQSSDPRLSLEPFTHMIHKLLFEGLLTEDIEGTIQKGLAESFETSPDQTRYTFTLKKCHWSTGDPITADDFIHSWRKILSLRHSFSFPYIFYPIRNARAIVEEGLDPSSLGVSSPNPRTLVIDLEKRAPHFLHYLTLSPFVPIHQANEALHIDWTHFDKDLYPTSGPYYLHYQDFSKHWILKKNPHYWDEKKIKIDHIDLKVQSQQVKIETFVKDQNDWIGAPLMAWKKEYQEVTPYAESLPNLQTIFFFPNVCHPILKNKHIRQALSLGIDRKALKETLAPYETTALPSDRLLSPNLSTLTLEEPKFDRDQAQSLLKLGCQELNLSLGQISPLSIWQASENKKERKALLDQLQNQIKENLGITLEIHYVPWKYLWNHQIKKQNCLSINSWQFLCKTPFYLFDFFAYPTKTTFNHWHNEKFQTLLQSAYKTEDENTRTQLIKTMETLFLDEMPVIPLFHLSKNYLKSPKLKGVSINAFGLFDLKEAHVNHQK